jgi:hypothetical protein
MASWAAKVCVLYLHHKAAFQKGFKQAHAFLRQFLAVPRQAQERADYECTGNTNSE